MIHLRGITQTYQGSQGPVEALRGIDLQITPGEVFGIIGRSGAGKSSLVRVINLLNRPTRGEVIVNGRDLTKLNDSQLREARRDIGMVFQHFNLLSSRTVYDNVALPLELAPKKKLIALPQKLFFGLARDGKSLDMNGMFIGHLLKMGVKKAPAVTDASPSLRLQLSSYYICVDNT